MRVELPTAQDTRALGGNLAGVLRRGDLVILTGQLGAGKTTLVQGLGEALNVRGAVSSPTFIIARVHPPRGDGPALVHADAYRLDSLAQLDDLDLDCALQDSVTVVEWGHGLAEQLSTSRLEIELLRSHGVAAGEARVACLRPIGPRWAGIDLAGRLGSGRSTDLSADRVADPRINPPAVQAAAVPVSERQQFSS
jgi:tRNA threonylcarbamoyladenosine biosynthesis protein TsaE